MKTKICTKCKIEKPLSEFYKQASVKSGYRGNCKQCSKSENKKFHKLYNKERNEKRKNLRKMYPWKRTLESMKDRCNNPNRKDYKYYGLRGIKCLITEEELKFLWFRDKAYLMKKPSIDRSDNDGHYELSNCQYIELVENIIKEKRVSILQYDIQDNFIREFQSIAEASRSVKGDTGNIISVLKGKRNKAYGFKWEYKKENNHGN